MVKPTTMSTLGQIYRRMAEPDEERVLDAELPRWWWWPVGLAGLLVLALLAWAIALTVLYANEKGSGGSKTDVTPAECACVRSLATGGNPALFDVGPALGPDHWNDYDAYVAFSCAINVSDYVLCVDGDATRKSSAGSGKCWADPYATLDAALAKARAHPGRYCAIFVADGEYRPSTTYAPSGVRAGAFSLPENNPGITAPEVFVNYSSDPAYFDGKLETFDLVDGVAIYGGFQGQSGPNGGEQSSAERIRGAYPTVLVGERANDHSTAVWHVLNAGDDIAVTGVQSRLDGLTVRGGDCLVAPFFPVEFFVPAGLVPVYYHDDGGGLYVFVRSEIAVHDCIFEDNAAVVGAAIFAHDGSTVRVTASDMIRQRSVNGAYNGRSGGPSDRFTNGSTVASTTTLQFVRSKLIDPIYADIIPFAVDYAPMGIGTPTNTVAEPIGLQYDVVGSLFNQIDVQVRPEDSYWGIINVWAPNGRLRLISTSITNVAGQLVAVTDPWNGGNFEMRRCYIANTTSPFSAVLLETTDIPNYAIIEQTRFHNCTSLESGGAVGAVSIGSLEMRDCTFTNNTALDRGGALYLNVPSSVHDNVFVFNNASIGPDVYVASGPPPALDNIFCDGYDGGVVIATAVPFNLPAKNPPRQ